MAPHENKAKIENFRGNTKKWIEDAFTVEYLMVAISLAKAFHVNSPPAVFLENRLNFAANDFKIYVMFTD